MLKKFKGFFRLHSFKKSRYPQRQVTIGNVSYHLREAVIGDIKNLIKVERLVYSGESPWGKSAFLAELYSHFKHLYLCAIKDDQIIGFIGVRIMGKEAHITNVAVIPDYQRKGIGGFLLKESEIFAQNNKCEFLTLEVRVSNKDAQRLYRKTGFVSRRIKTAYYSEANEDALDMVRFLDD